MNFNNTFESTVTSAVTTVIDAVEQFFDDHFTDNVTLNIDFKMADLSATNGLGASNTPFNVYSYSSIQTALAGDATTTDDNTAVADDVPTTDPITGTHSYILSRAEAKSLGLISGSDSTSDGTITLNSAANTFDLNRADGITTGLYDLAGTIAHEISEVMGRTMNVGGTVTLNDGTMDPNTNYLLEVP